MFGLNDLLGQAQGQIAGGYANAQPKDLTIGEALDAEILRRRQALDYVLALQSKLNPDLLKMKKSEIGQLLSF